MTPPPPVALVGVSGFARVHYAELCAEHERGRLVLAAACVINPDEEAEKCAHLRGLGCRLYGDYAAMLAAEAGRVDICVIPTGIHLHAPMTIAAVEAGCQVLVEKPAAATLADCDAMAAAAAAYARRVAVGFQHCYFASTHRIQDALDAGAIGRLRSLWCVGLWPRADAYYVRNPWAGRRTVDGVPVNDVLFNNAFAHHVNLAALFAGGPATSVRARCYRSRPIETCDTALLDLDFPRGVHAHLYLTHCAARNAPFPAFKLVGDAGRIHWDSWHGAVLEGADGSREELAAPETSRHMLWDQLLPWFRGEQARVCPLDTARNQLAIALAALDAPVIDLAPDAHEIRDSDDGRFRVLPGIDARFEHAFAAEEVLEGI